MSSKRESQDLELENLTAKNLTVSQEEENCSKSSNFDSTPMRIIQVYLVVETLTKLLFAFI